MDNVERLSNAFNLPPNCSVESRLDALMDLGHLHDPRVVVFLLQVLADRREATTECVSLLQRLSTDEILGRCARRVLASWHLS